MKKRITLIADNESDFILQDQALTFVISPSLSEEKLENLFKNKFCLPKEGLSPDICIVSKDGNIIPCTFSDFEHGQEYTLKILPPPTVNADSAHLEVGCSTKHFREDVKLLGFQSGTWNERHSNRAETVGEGEQIVEVNTRKRSRYQRVVPNDESSLLSPPPKDNECKRKNKRLRRGMELVQRSGMVSSSVLTLSPR